MIPCYDITSICHISIVSFDFFSRPFPPLTVYVATLFAIHFCYKVALFAPFYAYISPKSPLIPTTSRDHSHCHFIDFYDSKPNSTNQNPPNHHPTNHNRPFSYSLYKRLMVVLLLIADTAIGAGVCAMLILKWCVSK